MRALACSLVAVLSAPAAAAVIEPYAGGSIGDGLPATAAPMQPMGVAVDAQGNIYLSDQATARVRRVDAATGLVSTVVGSTYGWCGYGGPGTSICLAEPRGLALDAAGRLWITEATGAVQRWDPATGQVTHIAGHSLYDGQACLSGNDVPAVDACLGEVWDVAVDDSTGTAFVLGSSKRRVFRIDPDTGQSSFYAGCGFSVDLQLGEGGPATSACLGYSQGVAVDPQGNVFIASLFNEGRIWRVDAATKIITRVAGGGQQVPACLADGLPATQSCFVPRDVTLDGAGNFFTIGFQGSGIRRVDAATQTMTAVMPAAGEWQIAAGPGGELFTAGASRTYRIDPGSGTVTPVAGNGTTSFCGDGLPATEACLGWVSDIATDGPGNLFFVDPWDTNRIRRVDATTRITSTVATGGQCFDAPDDEPAHVCFGDVVRLAASPSGNLWVADVHGNDDEGFRQLVRRLDPATGALTTVAGRCTQAGTDGIPALDACLGNVADLAAAANGDLFLAEGTRVRRMDAVTGLIETVAGTGDVSCVPDQDPSGPALEACLRVYRLSVLPDGTPHLVSRAANGGDLVLRLDLATHILTRIAGRADGVCERVEDGFPATVGCMNIQSLAGDAAGNLFAGSRGVVRLIDGRSHAVTTLAGRPPDPSGFDPCCEACTNPPECLRATDLALGPAGRLLTAEPEKRQVRSLVLTCGDGVLGEDEACDDGNLAAGDGCDPTCRPSVCGVAPASAAKCQGETIPAGVARAIAKACRLATAFGETPARHPRRFRRSMARHLGRAQRRLERARGRGRLAPACAEALLAEL